MSAFDPKQCPRAAHLDELVRRILGGDPAAFFDAHWRRTPLHVRQAAAAQAGAYGPDALLRDLATAIEPPYSTSKVVGDRQSFTRHQTADSLRAAVEEGEVAWVKLSQMWHTETLPPLWRWSRALFGRLCRAVAMLYLTPALSEDCDFFLAGPSSSLGQHYDRTDVFTLQLYGRRRWQLDARVDPESAATASKQWKRGHSVPFQTDPIDITLEPGDTLYVPAYAVHRVTGVDWSVALSLGLRVFNELDVLDHMVQVLRQTAYPELGMLPALPRSCTGHASARRVLLERMRLLLDHAMAGAELLTDAGPSLPESLQADADDQGE